MPSLFKNRILKEKLEKYHIEDLEGKVLLVRKWFESYEKGDLQLKTESQCEQSFNNDFFIKILGYTTFPEENYTIQPKDRVESGGGQIPDATIGSFSNRQKRVIAVVEIKDANTSLDKAQYRVGNLTPVQQAFKYKPQYKDCKFVIATNFYEIRIFKDNQLDYEKFTLKELINPKDDYYNFRKFYYLLCEENFVRDKGNTKTENLLSAVRVEQEKITIKFYSDYKQLRKDLILDILKNNKGIRRSNFYGQVVEKAQKIIDRIVFVCFFEDSGLLPENKLVEVVEYAQKGFLDEPIWETMKKFFKAVDEGSDKLGVPFGYNGELFKYDPELNDLTISDEVCKKFVNLTRYDFEEDLSINILGHIFEQSISDLEKLRSVSESNEILKEKTDNKRKKDGIFYTPEYIVEYIVNNSLGLYLQENEQTILAKYNLQKLNNLSDKTQAKKLTAAYVEYQNFVRNIKVLDPACGSGAFLVKIFDFLLLENKRVSNILSELSGKQSLFDTVDYVKGLLQNNIYGVDLNQESVEITKLSLWFKSAKKGQKLVTLKDNIKCGNSLISDQQVAGDKAFDWEKQFPEIMSSGGFDIVIGNPPYVDSESMVKNDPISREFISKNYKSAKGNWDLYITFIEKALELTKKNGYTSMIVPNKWLSMDYGRSIREIIANKIILLADYSNLKVFEDASIFPIIFSCKQNEGKDLVIEKFISETDSDNWQLKNQLKEELSWGMIFNKDNRIIDDIESGSSRLDEFADVFGAFTTSEAYELIDLIEDIKSSTSDYYRLTNTGTIERFYSEWGFKETSYLKNKYLYPVVSKERFKQLFAKRYEKFNKTKIITTGIRYFKCILDDSDIYLAGKSTTVITNIKEIDPYFLTCLLNSTLISYYIKNKYAMSGMDGGINFSPDMIKAIPIKGYNIQSNFYKEKYNIVHELSNRLNKMILDAQRVIKVELKIDKLNTKQANFFQYTPEEFTSLWGKSINIEKKIDLINLVERLSTDINELNMEISRVKKEIEENVYNLYGIDYQDKELILTTPKL